LGVSLDELAAEVGAEVRGDGTCRVERVATLQHATAGAISFLVNPKYRRYLAGTGATAVILGPGDADACPVTALVSSNPHLAYARVAALLNPPDTRQSGCHPSAVVADSAQVDTSAWIGPGVVIEDRVEIAARVFVGPGCVIGCGCRIGEDSRLVARVTLCRETLVGKRALIHPGAVLGSDGFGLAKDGEVWVKVPQLGRVCIGDDVEIGANTTIDRGALEDTVIRDGVKLDNQIQIAHNVEIGEHTAIAACVGISGSTRVGRSCTLGGGVGLAGHLEFADNVHFTGQSLVTRSFLTPGLYSGNLPATPNREWKRNMARLRHLDEMWRRLTDLEKQVQARLSMPDQGEFDDGL